MLPARGERTRGVAGYIGDRLDLDRYSYFHSTRAVLLHRAGRHVEAADEFATALRLMPDGPERRALQRRVAGSVTAPAPPDGPDA